MNYFEKMCQMTQYKPKTSLWNELTFMEKFGEIHVSNKIEYLIEQYRTKKEAGTELVLILNWKMWEHSETNISLAKLYQKYWKELDSFIVEHWTEDDLRYFLQETD